jgi:spore maturation protein SpmB
LFATLVSTIVGVSIALLLAMRDRRYLHEFRMKAAEGVGGTSDELQKHDAVSAIESPTIRIRPSRVGNVFFYFVVLAFFIILSVRILTTQHPFQFISGEVFSFWLMPFLMLLIVSYGIKCGIDVYEVVTRGAKQGFDVAVRIIPYLVVILVAIGMFRASGAMDLMVGLLSPITSPLHIPADVVPMAILRPLSGSGAFAVMSSLVSDGPNSYSAFVASVMQGSTETTFYVLAVYFGAIGIVRIRYALVAALAADVAGILAAGFFSKIFFVGS